LLGLTPRLVVANEVGRLSLLGLTARLVAAIEVGRAPGLVGGAFRGPLERRHDLGSGWLSFTPLCNASR
jgi:hypothetical protein